MSTKSRQVIWGGRIMGAKMRAETARQKARKAARAVDRAEADRWSIRMEGYGGPAQPSPTIGQCLNGGYGWLEIECCRCKTRQVCRWTLSEGRVILRSGSWSLRSAADRAERVVTSRRFG
jgi:hypothetical protein